MYKTIIPDLVSLDTDLNYLKGFITNSNLNFFKPTKDKQKFHYKIIIDNNFKVDHNYSFRNAYYWCNNQGVFFYERKIFNLFFLKFKYDSNKKTFTVNKNILKTPFQIGGVFTFGSILSNLLALDLFLSDYLMVKGFAFQYKNKNYSIIAPSFNGKTVFLKKILEKNAKYISGDLLVLDIQKKEVFPFGDDGGIIDKLRDKNNKKYYYKQNKESKITKPVKTDKQYFVFNQLEKTEGKINQKYTDFILLNNLRFLKDLFLNFYIFKLGLSQDIFKKTISLNEELKDYKIMNIKNYDYDSLL